MCSSDSALESPKLPASDIAMRMTKVAITEHYPNTAMTNPTSVMLAPAVEIIPTFREESSQGQLLKVDILPTQTGSVGAESISESAHNSSENNHDSKQVSLRDTLWSIFVFLVPFYLLISLAYSMRGLLLERPGGVSAIPSTLLDNLASNWDHFASEFDLVDEVWIGFIAWSSTNLFVRRRLNPEIGATAFEK